MSGHSPLRKDKTCLNCRHVVSERYCPNCGQENTDTRKTFHHLFIHFFEDLTHYENAFWKTIRHLLFRPARLTQEYLSGKRLSYLAPVRLYIFISFVTFFLIAVIPNADEEQNTIGPVEIKTKEVYQEASKGFQDSIKEREKDIDKLLKEGTLNEQQAEQIKNLMLMNASADSNSDFLKMGYKSVKELDSVQKVTPPADKLSPFEYNIAKKYTQITNTNTRAEIFNKFLEAFMHNFPKVLFIYMPLFAFFLWLFHDKKKWYYFDHGIFTLHYFSFLLLLTLMNVLIDSVLSYCGNLGSSISGLISFVTLCWLFYYFFPAHHRFYGESRGISLLKSIALLFINFFLIAILLTFYCIYILLNLH